ncbi:hypothetical protein P879_02970 [Paragonimus westermani]|uniref:Uncharacterized protein n=1 Tax=Paragonimus westermani TaxID=34504 RepID=A0A8T0D6U3_9TREM|nr:hypothetical protein P879_02970 [Paragonimus westermani]
MNFQLPPVQAVCLVTRWFSQWNEWEREIFVHNLSTLEQTDCYLSIEPPISCSDSVSHDDAVDTYLASIIDSGLRLGPDVAGQSTVFECQLRLFHKWYPDWPLEQRCQLAECLKQLQLQFVHSNSSLSSAIPSSP